MTYEYTYWYKFCYKLNFPIILYSLLIKKKSIADQIRRYNPFKCRNTGAAKLAINIISNLKPKVISDDKLFN